MGRGGGNTCLKGVVLKLHRMSVIAVRVCLYRPTTTGDVAVAVLKCASYLTEATLSMGYLPLTTKASPFLGDSDSS